MGCEPTFFFLFIEILMFSSFDSYDHKAKCKRWYELGGIDAFSENAFTEVNKTSYHDFFRIKATIIFVLCKEKKTMILFED